MPDQSASSGGAAGPHDPGGDTLRILRDDPHRALERLEGRIASGRADYRTWHNLAVAHANLGDLDRGLEAVLESLRQAPDSTVTHFLHGKLLAAADRHQEALAAFQEVESRAPHYRRLAAQRGVASFFLEDLPAAVADLRRATLEDPADTASRFNLAVVYVVQRDFAAAQEQLEELIGRDPAHAREYHQFLIELGRTQVVEETLTQTHRIKNFMGIVGDRLRRVCERITGQLDPEGTEDLHGIRDDYERIYGDLVVFLRAIQPRTIKLHAIDLRRLLDRVVFVASQKGAGVSIQRQYAKDLPDVRCDPEMLQEAFLNLLLNAIDAVEEREGGTAVHIHAVPDGTGVRVSFIDDGIGIAPGNLDRIFQFGFTTKGLGTGIGLSFTQRIVEEHGGSVTVESESGRGTTIHCLLPTSPVLSENLSNRALRVQLFQDPRELILKEEEEMGI